MPQEQLKTIRTHLVPITLFAGATYLLISTSLNVLLGDFPILFEPPIGITLAVSYILLGGAYEWTIKKEKELGRYLQKQKQHLKDLELNEFDDT